MGEQRNEQDSKDSDRSDARDSIPAALGCAAAETAAESALRAVLEGRYAAMKSAMADRDQQAVAALLAPGFLSIDVSGKSEDASQMLQELAALPKDPRKASETTLLSVEVSGDTATVEQRYHMTTTKTSPDERSHAVELVTLSTDTWIKSGEAWLLQRTATNQLDYTVDGRPVAHKVRPSGP